jgi:hypothetical protein
MVDEHSDEVSEIASQLSLVGGWLGLVSELEGDRERRVRGGRWGDVPGSTSLSIAGPRAGLARGTGGDREWRAVGIGRAKERDVNSCFFKCTMEVDVMQKADVERYAALQAGRQLVRQQWRV